MCVQQKLYASVVDAVVKTSERYFAAGSPHPLVATGSNSKKLAVGTLWQPVIARMCSFRERIVRKVYKPVWRWRGAKAALVGEQGLRRSEFYTVSGSPVRRVGPASGLHTRVRGDL